MVSFDLCSIETNQVSSNCIVRLIKSMLVQKSVEEFRASNQVSNGGFCNLYTVSLLSFV